MTKKPKAKTLARVTYERAVTGSIPVRSQSGGIVQLKCRRLTACRRFTVRRRLPGLRKVLGIHSDFMLWDKMRDTRSFSTKTFRTRAAAWRYLRTHTTESKEYRLWEVELALDGDAA